MQTIIYEKNRGASVKPQPVHYYIHDRDTLPLLKKVYRGEGITKAELANDHKLLVKFLEMSRHATNGLLCLMKTSVKPSVLNQYHIPQVLPKIALQTKNYIILYEHCI